MSGNKKKITEQSCLKVDVGSFLPHARLGRYFLTFIPLVSSILWKGVWHLQGSHACRDFLILLLCRREPECTLSSFTYCALTHRRHLFRPPLPPFALWMTNPLTVWAGVWIFTWSKTGAPDASDDHSFLYQDSGSLTQTSPLWVFCYKSLRLFFFVSLCS